MNKVKDITKRTLAILLILLVVLFSMQELIEVRAQAAVATASVVLLITSIMAGLGFSFVSESQAQSIANQVYTASTVEFIEDLRRAVDDAFMFRAPPPEYWDYYFGMYSSWLFAEINFGIIDQLRETIYRLFNEQLPMGGSGSVVYDAPIVINVGLLNQLSMQYVHINGSPSVRPVMALLNGPAWVRPTPSSYPSIFYGISRHSVTMGEIASRTGNYISLTEGMSFDVMGVAFEVRGGAIFIDGVRTDVHELINWGLPSSPRERLLFFTQTVVYPNHFNFISDTAIGERMRAHAVRYNLNHSRIFLVRLLAYSLYRDADGRIHGWGNRGVTVFNQRHFVYMGSFHYNQNFPGLEFLVVNPYDHIRFFDWGVLNPDDTVMVISPYHATYNSGVLARHRELVPPVIVTPPLIPGHPPIISTPPLTPGLPPTILPHPPGGGVVVLPPVVTPPIGGDNLPDVGGGILPIFPSPPAIEQPEIGSPGGTPDIGDTPWDYGTIRDNMPEGSTLLQTPDGTIFLTLPDGKVIVFATDGSVFVRRVGVEHLVRPNELTILEHDGIITTPITPPPEFNSGTRIIIWRGYEIIIEPDFTIVIPQPSPLPPPEPNPDLSPEPEPPPDINPGFPPWVLPILPPLLVPPVVVPDTPLMPSPIVRPYPHPTPTPAPQSPPILQPGPGIVHHPQPNPQHTPSPPLQPVPTPPPHTPGFPNVPDPDAPPGAGSDEEDASDFPSEDSDIPPPPPREPEQIFAMFPFCIPWDVYNFVVGMTSIQIEPRWEFEPFPFLSALGVDVVWVLDFEMFRTPVLIFRYLMLALALWGLFSATKRFIWTGGG